MRQTPVDDYLEEISTRLPEELYGNLSDAIYETVCEFDEEVAQLKAENAKLRKLAEKAWKAAEMLCQAFDGPCRDDGVTIAKPCPMGERDEECVYGQLQRDLRELCEEENSWYGDTQMVSVPMFDTELPIDEFLTRTDGLADLAKDVYRQVMRKEPEDGPYIMSWTRVF